jgi:hypothetical protein
MQATLRDSAPVSGTTIRACGFRIRFGAVLACVRDGMRLQGSLGQ